MPVWHRLRRSWYRGLRVGPAVLLIAVLPSVLYLDHWVEYAGRALGSAQAADVGEFDGATHAAHCHLGPASCSDQPVPASPQVFASVVELVRPELYSVALESDETRLEEFTVSPLTEPPRV